MDISSMTEIEIEKELGNGRRDALQYYNAYYTFLDTAIHRILMNEQGRTH